MDGETCRESWNQRSFNKTIEHVFDCLEELEDMISDLNEQLDQHTSGGASPNTQIGMSDPGDFTLLFENKLL